MGEVLPEAWPGEYRFAGLCISLSPCGHSRCCLCLIVGPHSSTFLPPFPWHGFATRAFPRPLAVCSTMRALTPADPSQVRQVSPLTPLCLPGIPIPITLCARASRYLITTARTVRSDGCGLSPLPPHPGFAIRSQARRSHPAETDSSTCGLLVRFRLLSTPPRDDAVTFSYMCSDSTWHGLAPCRQSVLTDARPPSTSWSGRVVRSQIRRLCQRPYGIRRQPRRGCRTARLHRGPMLARAAGRPRSGLDLRIGMGRSSAARCGAAPVGRNRSIASLYCAFLIAEASLGCFRDPPC